MRHLPIMRSRKPSCRLKYPAPHFAPLWGRLPSGQSSCDYSNTPSYWNHCDLFEGWTPVKFLYQHPIDKCVTWILITDYMVDKDVSIANCDNKNHEPDAPIFFVFHCTTAIRCDNNLHIQYIHVINHGCGFIACNLATMHLPGWPISITLRFYLTYSPLNHWERVTHIYAPVN